MEAKYEMLDEIGTSSGAARHLESARWWSDCAVVLVQDMEELRSCTSVVNVAQVLYGLARLLIDVQSRENTMWSWSNFKCVAWISNVERFYFDV